MHRKWALLLEGSLFPWRARTWAWCGVPVARVERWEVLVRNRPKGSVGVTGGAGESKATVVRRRRVLHVALQQPARGAIQKYDEGSVGGVPIGQDFLVALLRQLVRGVGEDRVYLAVYGAAGETGLSKEDCKRVIASLRREQDEHSFFPKGFM